MTLRWAWTAPTGRLQITEAAPKEKIEAVKGPLTDQEYYDFVFERSISESATDVVELPEDWIPPDVDRSFRNAWKLNIDKVEVDLVKARDIFRERMRSARAPLLKQLDTDYLRADENVDVLEKQRIASEKQTLRNITSMPEIDAVKDVTELRNVWPAVLGENPYSRIRS